ncbi:type IV pilus modification PilV family protein [Inhella gelatinilytica]|uniref:Type II secretion system protein n=1 Tax=Inhella gelatinilytica TaxID=2795030 RepID=A0A931IWT8_9BURK|nr:type II secretion system protein [Inhella gelatinilytica]MBH9551326.1 type II secretion system protein [Inhella gelatinilytica]
MWSSRATRGFTLVEMIIAILVLGFGLAGVLVAFQQTTKGSADPLIHRQLLSVAEGYLEEVLSRPFASNLARSVNGCARDGFHDVDDYAGFTNQSVCPIDSTTPVSGLELYTVSIAVEAMALNGVAADQARRITVTAQRSDGQSLTLVGWRTHYAGP